MQLRPIYYERTEEPSEQAADFGLLACTSRPAQGRGVVGHIEQNWIRVISGQCCRAEMELCTVVYDHSDKLEDVDLDEEPILVIFFVFRVRCMTASGKGICHQKPSEMHYPPAPSRQLLPKDVNVGVRTKMM